MFAQAAKAFYAGFKSNVFFSLKLGNMASCTAIILSMLSFYTKPRDTIYYCTVSFINYWFYKTSYHCNIYWSSFYCYLHQLLFVDCLVVYIQLGERKNVKHHSVTLWNLYKTIHSSFFAFIFKKFHVISSLYLIFIIIIIILQRNNSMKIVGIFSPWQTSPVVWGFPATCLIQGTLTWCAHKCGCKGVR